MICYDLKLAVHVWRLLSKNADVLSMHIVQLADRHVEYIKALDLYKNTNT